jgi:hypothetical protein
MQKIITYLLIYLLYPRPREKLGFDHIKSKKTNVSFLSGIIWMTSENVTHIFRLTLFIVVRDWSLQYLENRIV